jgi:RHS repeat-associated protein
MLHAPLPARTGARRVRTRLHEALCAARRDDHLFEFLNPQFSSQNRHFARMNTACSAIEDIVKETYDPNSNRTASLQHSTLDINKDGSFGFGNSTDTRSNTQQNLNIAANSNKLLGFQQSITSLRKSSASSNTQTLSTTASTVTYQLDANGNLTSDGLRDYQYDASDRLSKTILGTTFVGTDTIPGNELARHSYLHNAAGQRVFKSEPQTEATAPSETTLGSGFVDWLRKNFSWLWVTAQTNATLGDSYLYAEEGSSIPNWALLGEYGNGGANSTGRTEYLWLPTDAGGQANPAIPVGVFRGGQFYSIQTDHLGTPRLMKDNKNTAVWQWPYSAFGDNPPTGTLRTSTSPNSAIATVSNGAGNTPTYWVTSGAAQKLNLRFPGQYFDSESNLHYNYFRNYQPTQGRYTQNDPIGLVGGWNRMGYVEANPLSMIDPEGLLGQGSGSNTGQTSGSPIKGDPFGCKTDTHCQNVVTLKVSGVCEPGDTMCAMAMRAAGIQGPYYYQYKKYDWVCMLKLGIGVKGSMAAAGVAAGKHLPGLGARAASAAGAPLAGAYIGAAGTTVAEISAGPIGMTISVIGGIHYVAKHCECNQ